ncbi:YigZ family protein [Salinicoccus roseus]|uniref:YigZ family protein n=2 Tax=Salinicoccus roseus TaxID=45670 RepID=A0ABT4YFY7_9STAP|nr:YigZ family protein [Salinicoccus roseus]MDB0579748.1 YigZ family protein [Salinicoccus roseus]
MEQQYMNRVDTTTETTINKSRFIAYIQRTDSEEAAKSFINSIKSRHKDANHNCSAYILTPSALIQKADDDGEPSGTAGVPILEVLKREGLYNVTVVVTRYFGGIKLGAGGLIRAYSGAASDAVNAAGKVVEINMIPYRITMDYTYTNRFEHELEASGTAISDTIYTDKVTYLVHVEEDAQGAFLDRVQEITKDTATLEEMEMIQAESPVE